LLAVEPALSPGRETDVLYFVRATLLTATLFLLLSPAWLCAEGQRGGKPVPEHEVFWRHPPKQDPDVVLLWHFDEKGEAGGEEVMKEFAEDLALEEEKPETGGTDLGGTSGGVASAPAVGFRLAAGAELVAEGRHGGGVRLAAADGVESEEIDWESVLKKNEITIELWVRPAAKQAGDCVALFAVPGKVERVPTFMVARTPDGSVNVRLGEKELLRHTLPAPTEQWTHVALRLARNGVFHLLVNGVSQTRAEGPVGLLARVIRHFGSKLIVGSLATPGEGFTGSVDEVRLSRCRRFYYELESSPFLDAAKKRPFYHEGPHFVRKAFHVHCSFDGTLKPETFHGLAAEDKPVKGVFAPGVRGQAIDLSRISETGFALRGHDVLPWKQGTVEFWFRPKSWNNFFIGSDYFGRDVPSRELMRLVDVSGKKPVTLKPLRIVTGIKGGDYGAKLRWVKYHPGKWTHVVITWGGGMPAAAYLDGKPQEFGQVFIGWGGPRASQAMKAWKKRTGGKDDGTHRLVFVKSGTLVDEFRVYPYAFESEEAWNAYVRYHPDFREKLVELPAVRATYGYVAHSWHMVEKLDIRLSCLPVNEVDAAKASLSVLSPNRDETMHTGDLELDENGRGSVSIEERFDFGTYPVHVTSRSAEGKELTTAKLEYVREKPPWWKNQVGKERTVPPPWTPIEAADGPILKVWGRTVRLDQSGLPASIVAVGRELLARPVRVHGQVGGNAVELAGQGATITETSEDIVRWEGRLASNALRAEVETWMEFDRLMYYTVTLKPPGDEPVEVERLKVDFLLRAEESTQYICNSGGQNFRASWDAGFIPKGEGSVWSTLKPRRRMQRASSLGNYCPNIWVGGDDCGINYSGDNDQGWTPDNKAAAQELIREGGNVIYRMNIITKPVKIKQSRTFTFIIIPTPTKPMPKGWRGWNRSVGVPYSVVDGIDAFLGHNVTASPDKPAGELNFKIEPISWEDAKAQGDGLQKKIGPGNPRLMYIDYSWPKFGPSIADWNHDLHAGTGRLAWTPEVEDYFVWTMNEYFKRDIIDGLYIDDTSMGRTFSLASTAYPFPEVRERRRVGFNSMGFRRFLKRCYRALVAQGKTPYIAPHMTYCFEMPALSFCAGTVNGEARDIHPYTKRNAIATWSRTELRVMGNGPKWGFATFWKPCIQQTEMVKDKRALQGWMHRQSRAMHALIPQHDIWYYWHYPSANSILPSFYEFGMDAPDLRFIPYWRMEGVAEASGGKEGQTLLGIWAKKGRALMMISNLDKDDHELIVSVEPSKVFGEEVGEVEWKDIDCSLERPEDLTAMARGKGIPKVGAAAENILDGEEELTEEQVNNEMEGVTPKQREQQRLAPRPDGNKVTLVVRGRDYRLLQLRVP